MRLFMRLFFVRFKAALTSVSVLFLLLFAALSVLPAALLDTTKKDTLSLAVVNEDYGPLGAELVSALQKQESMRIYSVTRKEAMRMLANGGAEVAAVLLSDYSQNLLKAQFRDTVELYVSSSSRATAAASEPILGQTMLFFMEEAGVIRAREFLKVRGLTLSKEAEAALRRDIHEVRRSEAFAKVVSHIPPDKSLAGDNDPVVLTLRYYAAFSVFYILVSAGWVADVSSSHLTLRIRQMGIKRVSLLLSAGLAHAALCLLCGIGMLFLGTLLGGGTALAVLTHVFALCVYIVAMLGLTLMVAAFARQNTALFLIAPAFTFLNAALSGLLFPLPDWAAFLTLLTRVLPGRQLALYIATGEAVPFLVCACVYCTIGILLGLFLNSQQVYEKKGDRYENAYAKHTV